MTNRKSQNMAIQMGVIVGILLAMVGDAMGCKLGYILLGSLISLAYTFIKEDR